MPDPTRAAQSRDCAAEGRLRPRIRAPPPSPDGNHIGYAMKLFFILASWVAGWIALIETAVGFFGI